MTGALFIISFIVILILINLSHKIEVATNQYYFLKNETDKQIRNLLKRIEHLEKMFKNADIQKPASIIDEESRKNIQPAVHPEPVTEAHITSEHISEAHIVHEQAIKPEPSIPHTNVKEVVPAQSIIENKSKQDSSMSFENLFIGNIFSKIGGIILVIAIFFLVKLSSEFIEFTPQLNITLANIVSALLLGVSLYMQEKLPKVTTEILSGVSIAGFLLSNYFGCFYYNLFPVSIALIIAFAIAIIAYIISEKFNSFSTIAIGLFGGYLNPATFSVDISINIMFGYMTALNLISLIYTYRNGNKNIINCINIFLTLCVIAVFSMRGQVPVVYPLTLWLLYIVYDILTILTGSKQEFANILRWFNFATLLLIVNHIFSYTNLYPIGLTILGAGIVYAIIYSCFRKRNDDISLMSLQGALLCLFFTTFYLVRAPYLGLAWAIEGFLVSELYLKLGNKFLQKYVLLFFCPAVIYLLVNYNSMFLNNEKYSPLIICLVFIAQAVIALYSSFRTMKTDIFLSTNLKMLGFSTLYLYVLFLVNTKEYLSNSKMYINSIISAIYSLHSYKILTKDYKDFANAISYFLYGISVFLLLIAECLTFKNLDFVPFFNIKFLAYLSLIALTIFYAKKRDVIFEYIAVVLGLFSLVAQIMCIFNSIVPEETMPLIITTFLIIYSGAILTAGILKNISSMKKTSVCLILILLTKLILIDLYNIDVIFKLLAFVIIGAILLGVSSYYQKRK